MKNLSVWFALLLSTHALAVDMDAEIKKFRDLIGAPSLICEIPSEGIAIQFPIDVREIMTEISVSETEGLKSWFGKNGEYGLIIGDLRSVKSTGQVTGRFVNKALGKEVPAQCFVISGV